MNDDKNIYYHNYAFATEKLNSNERIIVSTEQCCTQKNAMNGPVKQGQDGLTCPISGHGTFIANSPFHILTLKITLNVDTWPVY